MIRNVNNRILKTSGVTTVIAILQCSGCYGAFQIHPFQGKVNPKIWQDYHTNPISTPYPHRLACFDKNRCSMINNSQSRRPFTSTRDHNDLGYKAMTMASGNDYDDSDNDIETNDENQFAMNLYDALLLSVDQALKSNTKQETSLESEYEKAQQAEDKMHRANLITSNLYRISNDMESILVEDWENDGKEVLLELDTSKYSSPNEEAEALFSIARKMKRGSLVVKDLLETNKKVQQILTTTKLDLQRIYNLYIDNQDSSIFMEDINAIQAYLKKTQKTTKIKMVTPSSSTPSSSSSSSSIHSNKNNTNKNKANNQAKQSFRKFQSPDSGHKILVGRNRRENEQLAIRLAKPTDLWLHARGCPGAHVLIQKRRGDPPITDECLQFAADLAAFYSESRTERKAEITVAEPKHIVKPRGAPLGAVKIRQEYRTIIGNPMDVPEECKMKREENGNIWGDEGGMRSLGGKVKNKKKTASVTKQNVAKKRYEKRDKNKRRNKGKGDEIDDGPRTINGIVEGDWF